MKTLSALALISASSFIAAHGLTAVTNPVGYITHSIAGAGTNPSASTYISPTLINSVEYAGNSTASPSGGKTVALPSGVPTGLNSSYVLEITSVTGEGWWSTVTSSTTSGITVTDNFPANLPANVNVAVKKHATITSFMGFNTPGLIPYNGLDNSDEVQFLDPIDQSVTAFVFVTASDWGDPDYPNGVWLNLTSGNPENNAIIEPGTSVRIKRVGAGALSFVSTGTVKTTKTQVDIYPGFNFVGVPKAALGTLGNLNFASQLYQYDGLSPNYDELQKVAANQSATPFAAIDDGGPMMWNIAAGDYANTEPFLEGTGLLLKRVGHPSSTITLEGSVVAP